MKSMKAMKAILLCVPCLIVIATAMNTSPIFSVDANSATFTAAAQVPPRVFIVNNEYYPLKEGNYWIYRAIDSKSAEAKNDPLAKQDEKRRYPKVRIEVDRKEIYERRSKKDNKTEEVDKYVGFFLKSTSEGKTTFDHVVVMDEGVYRVSVAGTPITAPTPITPPLLFFKPVQSWECKSVSGNKTIKGIFTAKSENVSVPKGSFDAIVVSFRDGPENDRRIEIDYWFAKDVGLVKQRVKSKGNEMILELEEFKLAKYRR
jgi:hypothetical protein